MSAIQERVIPLPRSSAPPSPHGLTPGPCGGVISASPQRGHKRLCASYRALICLVVASGLGGCSESGPQQITGDVVKTWINQWLNPKAPVRAVSTAPMAMYVDVDAVARRHPAWQVANALEEPLTPLPPELQPLFDPRAPVAGPQSLSLAATAPATALPAQVVRSGTDEKSRRDQQAVAGDNFLATTSKRQTRQATEEEGLARQSLDERVDAARRAMLFELDPALLPDSVQRDLINLRLHVVVLTARIREERRRLDASAVPGTSSVRLDAEARWKQEMDSALRPLEAIEERWGLRLREQEIAQANRIRESYTEVPARIRREGEAVIVQEAAQRLVTRQAERGAVRQTRAELLDRDFAPGSLDLALRLPAAQSVPLPPAGQRHTIPKISQTSAARPPSDLQRFLILDAPLAAPGQGSSQKPEALRRLARLEATEWARQAVVSQGGTLTKDRKAPDRTAQTLRALFGPPAMTG